jgi:Lectin C-type domain
MKTILVLLGLSVLSIHAAVIGGPVTNAANGHVYYLLSQNNWTASQAEAVSLGGNLVTINDQAENDWVFQTFGSYGGQRRALWIGLTDREQEGTFTWVSGEISAFRSWSLVQPDNGSGAAVENYTYFWFPNFNGDGPTDGKWNDSSDVTSVHGVGIFGVVEVSGPPVPSTPVLRNGNLCWSTVSGVTYQAQWRPATSRGAWVNLGRPITVTGSEVCLGRVKNYGEKLVYRVLIVE